MFLIETKASPACTITCEWILSSKLDRQYQLIHIFCSYALQVSSDAIYGLNRDLIDEEDMGTIIETDMPSREWLNIIVLA
jgi:hypothetical protein